MVTFQDIIDYLELKKNWVKKHDQSKKARETSRYRLRGYNRNIYNIKSFYKNPEKIKATKKKLENMYENGELTKHMMEEFINFIKTPKKMKKKYEPPPTEKKKQKLKNDLIKVMGVGSKKADELIEMGLKSISQLPKPKYYKKLGKEAKASLKYKPLRKIPRNKIKKLEEKIKNESHLIDYEIIFVGSYRRKAPYSSDIDIMLVGKEKNKNKIMDNFINLLEELFKEVHIYSKGSDKASMIIINGKTAYKIDAFFTPKKYKWAMLLYSTGDKNFNIRMRAKAKRMGYILNQKGLFKKGKKNPIPVSSEKDFFDILEIPHKPPSERH